jgi:tRNA (adenine22-N1)-methyltransferase
MSITQKLSQRLLAAASLVREGAVVADVGTDHAYLPIALCLSGRAVRAVASDVNEGPIARARSHVEEYGLCDRIATLRCDGLCGIEPYAPTDVLILGMGGDLIVRILSEARWLKDPSRRLILQPMTHPEAVRAFLAEQGFAIVEERLVKEGKIYQILSAEYVGVTEEYSALELLCGKQNLARRDGVTHELCARWRSVFEERLRGKRTAGEDTSDEEQILAEITRWEEATT